MTFSTSLFHRCFSIFVTSDNIWCRYNHVAPNMEHYPRTEKSSTSTAFLNHAIHSALGQQDDARYVDDDDEEDLWQTYTSESSCPFDRVLHWIAMMMTMTMIIVWADKIKWICYSCDWTSYRVCSVFVCIDWRWIDGLPTTIDDPKFNDKKGNLCRDYIEI
jgi:hypothetical protein